MSILESDLSKYLVVAAMLMAILFGYWKGRAVDPANGKPRAWTRIPLIALALTSLGPSAVAAMIYLGYKFGLLQPEPSGFRFSTYIQDLPLDFLVINWPLAALYLVCRVWPGAARSAMWLSVIAMSLPNLLLFSLAPTMVSNVYDAGQGIGIVEAIVTFPIIAMIWPGSFPDIFDSGSGIGLALSALTGPMPIFGLMGWLVGQFVGPPPSRAKAPARSS